MAPCGYMKGLGFNLTHLSNCSMLNLLLLHALNCYM